VYAAGRPGRLSASVKGFPDLVYVPNSGSNTVDVIDPHTFKIIDHFAVGIQPQHVIPSYDLKTLWVANDLNDTLTRIDPATGHKLDTIKIKILTTCTTRQMASSRSLSPNGFAGWTSMTRARMKLVETLPVPCRGIDHMDFAANGRFLIASCEYSGDLVKVDVSTRKVLSTLKLPPGAMPQDVRLTPDGSVFYVADMVGQRLYVIEGNAFKVLEFIPTGKGTHGLLFQPRLKWLYVSNRGEGTISLLDVQTRKLGTNGGFRRRQPDMGGVSADGKCCGCLDDTTRRYMPSIPATVICSRGSRSAKARTVCALYPQPGRYSLGHTANLRYSER